MRVSPELLALDRRLWQHRARSLGPIAIGTWRVVVIEADLRISWKDFDALDVAKRCADDAAGEYADDDATPVARVFDEEFAIVHDGWPWYL